MTKKPSHATVPLNSPTKRIQIIKRDLVIRSNFSLGCAQTLLEQSSFPIFHFRKFVFTIQYTFSAISEFLPGIYCKSNSIIAKGKDFSYN